MPLYYPLLTLEPRRSPVTPSREGGKSSLGRTQWTFFTGSGQREILPSPPHLPQGYILYIHIPSNGCYLHTLSQYLTRRRSKRIHDVPNYCRPKSTSKIHYVLAHNHIVFIFWGYSFEPRVAFIGQIRWSPYTQFKIKMSKKNKPGVEGGAYTVYWQPGFHSINCWLLVGSGSEAEGLDFPTEMA